MKKRTKKRQGEKEVKKKIFSFAHLFRACHHFAIHYIGDQLEASLAISLADQTQITYDQKPKEKRMKERFFFFLWDVFLTFSLLFCFLFCFFFGCSFLSFFLFFNFILSFSFMLSYFFLLP